MNLKNYQDFQARLYTDVEFRRSFEASPNLVGTEFGLSQEQIVELSSDLSDELDFFSDTLLAKRIHAVVKLIPLTRELAGDDFVTWFRQFAVNFSPVTVKKHLEDAVAFLDFLAGLEIPLAVREAVIFERTKIRFFSTDRYFAICRIGATVREVVAAKPARRRKPRLAVWFRHGHRIRQLLI